MSETTEAVRKMSAAILAAGTGLGSQEIHWTLHRDGFLNGHPGAWSPTEKALPYVGEQFRQRGTGGYGFMNPSWDWLTWDPAVRDELDLSDAGKQWARQAVKDWRSQRPAREAAKAAAAHQELLRARAEKLAAAAAQAAAERAALGRVLLGLSAAAGVVVVLYKTVPLVRRRWHERAGASEPARDRDDHEAPPEGQQ